MSEHINAGISTEPLRGCNIHGIVWLPDAVDEQPQGVVIEELTYAHCKQWHETVQPLIAAGAYRADRDWNWKVIYALTKLSNLRKAVSGYAVYSIGPDGKPVLHAMIVFVHPVTSPRVYGEEAVYVAFLVSAPNRQVKMAGKAALDAAVITALADTEGHLWLHAAPGGSLDLMKYYLGLGFRRLPFRAKVPNVGPYRPTNDGRLLHIGEEEARALIFAMNKYRDVVYDG